MINKPHEAVGDGTVNGLCGAFVINRLMNLFTRRLRSWEIDEMPKKYKVISKPLWMHTQIFTATLVIVSSSIQLKICDVLTHRPKVRSL